MVMQQPLHLRIAPNVPEAWYRASINAATPPDGFSLLHSRRFLLMLLLVCIFPHAFCPVTISKHVTHFLIPKPTHSTEQVTLTRASLDTWKPLFWFGAGPPVLLIIFRLWLPETVVYQPTGASNEKGNIYGFLVDFNTAVRLHWCLLCYLVAFMAGCAFLVSTC